MIGNKNNLQIGMNVALSTTTHGTIEILDKKSNTVVVYCDKDNQYYIVDLDKVEYYYWACTFPSHGLQELVDRGGITKCDIKDVELKPIKKEQKISLLTRIYNWLFVP